MRAVGGQPGPQRCRKVGHRYIVLQGCVCQASFRPQNAYTASCRHLWTMHKKETPLGGPQFLLKDGLPQKQASFRQRSFAVEFRSQKGPSFRGNIIPDTEIGVGYFTGLKIANTSNFLFADSHLGPPY